MSDLRDFNGRSEPVIETNFVRPAAFDHSAERIDLSAEGLENSDIRPLDENSDMGAFRTMEPDVENSTTKIAAAVAVAIILGGAGVAGYMSSMKSGASAPAIAAATPLPKLAAATPTPTPVDNTSNSAMTQNAGQGVTPATSPEAAPAPVNEPAKPARSTAIRSARVDVTPKPDVAPVPEAQPQPAIGQQQQAAIPSVPEPVSPAAPASSYAANSPAMTPEAVPQAPAEAPAQAAPQDQQAQAAQPAQPTPDQAQPVPAQPEQPVVQPEAQSQPLPETAPAQQPAQ